MDIDYERLFLKNGSFLITSSYDNTCKIWSAGDYKPIKILQGDSKVMSCDISPNADFVATAAYDRTLKIYSAES